MVISTNLVCHRSSNFSIATKSHIREANGGLSMTRRMLDLGHGSLRLFNPLPTNTMAKTSSIHTLDSLKSSPRRPSLIQLQTTSRQPRWSPTTLGSQKVKSSHIYGTHFERLWRRMSVCSCLILQALPIIPGIHRKRLERRLITRRRESGARSIQLTDISTRPIWRQMAWRSHGHVR